MSKLFVDWNELNKLMAEKRSQRGAVLESGSHDDWPDPDLYAEETEAEERARPQEQEEAPLVDHQRDAVISDIREALEVEIRPDRTQVYMLVIDTENPRQNKQRAIPCNNGYGLSGYARVKDVAHDCYLLDCVEYLSVGTVPFSVEVSLPKTQNWKVQVPLPDRVVEKMLSPFYRRQVKAIKAKYPRPRYEIHYFQMLGC